MSRASLLILSVLALAGAPAAAQEPAVRVDKVAEDVFVFTNNTHRSLFVTTPAGVLATDPQSPEAAERYTQEITKISSAPVRYLVYSHHHDDHISGGAEFGDAVRISHASVPRHLPAAGGAILPPDVTFSDALSIFLGDLEVRLIYPGPSETESNIVLHIPARRLVFIVDSVVVRGLPWRDMSSGNPDQWIAALKRVSAIDFDTLVPGHGPVGTKADLHAFIEYLTTLRDAVATRMKRGQTLEQIQATLELQQYAEWERYDEHFTLNIAGVYRELAKAQK